MSEHAEDRSGMRSWLGPDAGLCCAAIEQSPISTWLADKQGTMVYENEANRKLLEAPDDSDVVGRYNLFEDEELSARGVIPQIRKVFDEGGSTEFTIEYSFSHLQRSRGVEPRLRVMRVFMFAVARKPGYPEYVVVQNEDCTAKVQAEKALSESEARFRELVEEISDWVWEVDVDLRYTYSSPAVKHVLGYLSEEIIGTSVFNYMLPEDAEECRKEFVKALAQASEIARLLSRYRRKDGCMAYLETSGSPMFDTQHRVTGLRGVDRDITERIRAQEQMRLSETELRALVSAMSDVVLVIDSQGRYVRIAQTRPELLYKPSAELLGKTLHDVFPAPTADRFLNSILRALKEQHTIYFEYPLTIRGSEVWFSAAVSPMTEDQVIWVARDITERKVWEERLKTSEREFKAIFDSALDAIVLADGEGRFTEANPAASVLFGMPRSKLPGRRISDFMGPDFDFEAAWANFMKARYQRGEVQVVRPDGTTRYVEFSASADILPGSNLLIWHDITERKQAQAALQETESKYRSLVEESLVGVYVIQDGRFVYVNPQLAEIFGYRSDELIGKPILETVAPESRQTVAENIRRRVEGETKSIHYTFRGLRKEGTVIDVEVHGTRTMYKGHPAVIGSLLNITKRVREEQQKAELEAHKREFYRRTILAATEGKLIVAEFDEICRVAGPPIEVWNIDRGEDLSLIRHEVTEIADSVGMNEARIYDFILAVGEATTNAYKHAGGGRASLHKVDEGLIFVVTDHGPGIEALTLPEVALVRGYSTAGTLGMGYKAILAVADRVYLATGPGGTTVAIEMKLHAPEAKPVTDNLAGIWAT